VDNVAHTLAGVVLAEAGLKRRTALGTITLAIAANFPDIDAVAPLFTTGAESLAIRRGWTHGVLAMVVLPFVLALLVLAWDRTIRQPRLRRRGRSRDPAHFGGLLLLAAIGIWSHPLLDLLNSYGVRLLMPFSDRWFYGDTLFIVDPWLWLIFAAGIFLSRRRAARTTDMSSSARGWVAYPARNAIAIFLLYVGVMAASGWWGRHEVRIRPPGGDVSTMVAPVPANPFRRQVVRELPDGYEVGRLLFAPGVRYEPVAELRVGRDLPGAAAAARTRQGASFLYWARFPRFQSERVGDSIRVRISDARYADSLGRGWASVVVMVPAAPSAPRAPR
jgi:inner membrane protein